MQKQKGSLFLIKSTLEAGSLTIQLDILDSETGTKIVRRFGKSYDDSNLPEDIKKNFEDISNVNCILNQSPQTCKVNAELGILTLTYNVVFPNGKKIELLGNLQLQEMQQPAQQKLDSSVSQKIHKIEDNIQKIFKILDQKQGDKKKILDDIKNQVAQLKESMEETKKWRKNQEQKNKQLMLLYHNDSHQQKYKPNLGISDQVMHMFDQKIDQLRSVFSDKFQKQAEKLEDLKDASARHHKIIDRLTQENVELKKTVKLLEQKSFTTAEKHEAIQANLTNLTTKSQKLIKRLSSHQQQLQQVKSELNTSPKKKQKLDPLQNFFQAFANQPSKPNVNPMQSPKAQNKTMISESMPIHGESGYSKQFINNSKMIAYNGVSEQPTQIVGKLNISTQRVSYLSIVKSRSNQIGFGIVDQKYVSQRNSIKRPHSIMLHGANGALYDSGSYVCTNQSGFKQGDKVKMRVNPIQGFIQWSIDGTVICRHKSSNILKDNVVWVPFARMSDRGDTIKWTLQ